jgi:hypothetical protein
MSDRAVDREMELNEERKVDEAENERKSVVDVVEDAVTTLVVPLSNQRLDTEDVEQQREANDADQRT